MCNTTFNCFNITTEMCIKLRNMTFNCSNKTTETDQITGVQNYVFIIINILLIICICGGNILTIVAVFRTTALRIVPNMYVVSLAVADFLAGAVFTLQILIFIPSLQETLNCSRLFCLFRHSSFFVSCSASVLSMVAIALDRALYIGHPFKYESLATVSRAKLVIVIIWIIALAVGTIPTYNNNWEPCGDCSIFKVLTKLFQVYILDTSFAICCILTVCCYGYILRIAKLQQVKIAELDFDKKNRKSAKDWKLIKLFCLVFGIFIICWIPAIVSVTVGHLGIRVPKLVTNITVPIAIINSAMNFIVYAVKNKDFRRAFAKMMCPKAVKNSLVGPTVINVSSAN